MVSVVPDQVKLGGLGDDVSKFQFSLCEQVDELDVQEEPPDPEEFPGWSPLGVSDDDLVEHGNGRKLK